MDEPVLLLFCFFTGMQSEISVTRRLDAIWKEAAWAAASLQLNSWSPSTKRVLLKPLLRTPRQNFLAIWKAK